MKIKKLYPTTYKRRKYCIHGRYAYHSALPQMTYWRIWKEIV